MFNTLKDLPLTFYSREFYQRLARLRTGMGMEFILVITLLACFEVSFFLYHPLTDASHRIDIVMQDLPEMTVKDHVISINHTGPYKSKVFDDSDTSTADDLVIDTSYTATDLTDIGSFMRKNKIFILVTANKLISQQGDDLRVDNFENLPDGTFGHETWVGLARVFKLSILPATFFFSFVTLFVASIVMVIMGALVTMACAILFRISDINFAEGMRIAGASCIPPSVVVLLVAMPYYVKLGIWLIYIVYGLSALQPVTSKR